MTNVSVTASQQRAARIAGLAYIFGILYVPVYLLTGAGLTVDGDPAATIANVQSNLLLFRIGIASTLVMFVSVFVLIAALYATVEPVNRNLALLGMVLRLPEATLGLLAVVFSLIVSQLASGNASVAGFEPQQVQSLVQLAVWGGSACRNRQSGFHGARFAADSVPVLHRAVCAAAAGRLRRADLRACTRECLHVDPCAGQRGGRKADAHGCTGHGLRAGVRPVASDQKRGCATGAAPLGRSGASDGTCSPGARRTRRLNSNVRGWLLGPIAHRRPVLRLSRVWR